MSDDYNTRQIGAIMFRLTLFFFSSVFLTELDPCPVKHFTAVGFPSAWHTLFFFFGLPSNSSREGEVVFRFTAVHFPSACSTAGSFFFFYRDCRAAAAAAAVAERIFHL